MRVVWLFGHPVGHSLSPTLHNAAFRHLGISLLYVARDVPSRSLSEAIEALRHPDSRGANLTIPHKEAALSMLDDVQPEVRWVNAVNTIVNDDGRLRGYNTDIEGFSRALRTVMPQGANGLRFLVLGAGGAARSVSGALALGEAAEVWVANRTRQRAEALCQEAASWGDTTFLPISLEEATEVVPNCEAIVNATAVGLGLSVKELPLDVDILRDDQVVIDLVYGRESTYFVEGARARGLVAIDGKEMLLQQAALSFELWTGIGAPLSVMRGSIDSCQG